MQASDGDPATAAVASIGAAVQRMQAIEAALPASDGIACFNRVYLDVTEQVEAQLTQGGFGDAAFMEAFDVDFANFYFAAVDAAGAGAPVPVAWRPLVDARANAAIFPIQFALAGMNAHINHDLPLALVQTCAARGVAPGDGQVHADYQKVDAVLDRVEQGVRQSFETGAALHADHDVQGVLDLVANWSINSARDVAWDTATVLWRCRDMPMVADLLMDSLARTVAMAARLLLVTR